MQRSRRQGACTDANLYICADRVSQERAGWLAARSVGWIAADDNTERRIHHSATDPTEAEMETEK